MEQNINSGHNGPGLNQSFSDSDTWNRNPVFNVIVIDDDKMIRSVFTKYLESWGFNVLATGNSFEGVSLAVSKNPAFIILDICIPEFDGEKVLNILKSIETTAKIPVIIVSGNMNMELLNSAYNKGADGFLSKPFTKDDLAESINYALGSDRFMTNEETAK